MGKVLSGGDVCGNARRQVAAGVVRLYPWRSMQRISSYCAGLAVLVLILSCDVVAQQQGDPGQPFRFGAFAIEIADLNDPKAVAIDGDGLIYIVESAAHRVSIFDRAGQPLRSWGSFGRQPGELAFPSGVAVLGSGVDAQVIVCDTGNHRVQVYSSGGRYIRGFGGLGTAPGQFNHPRGVAVDNDLLLVADQGNDRVQLLNHDGTVLKIIGESGMGDGQFTRPTAVAFDEQRNIYVADADNNRIQSFNLDGAFREAWGDYGPFAGLMDEPAGLVVRDDRVFVTDSRNHRVQVFQMDGQPVYQWGVHARLPREGQGVLHYPVDVAIAPAGDFAAICETFEDRVQVFDVAEPEVAEANAGSPFQSRPNQTHFGTRLSLAGNMLAIAEPETHSVYLFRIDGEIPIHITTHTGRGRATHQFMRLGALDVTVDPVQVLVGDAAMSRLQQFAVEYDRHESLRFRPLITTVSRAFDLNYFSRSIRNGDLHWSIEPTALERDTQGRLYVLDRRNALVHIFDSQMQHVRSIGDTATGIGRLRSPTDISIRNGRIYVVDAGDRQVKMYDIAGGLIGTFDAADSPGGGFTAPFGIEAGMDGFVYVTDAGSHRVVKFDVNGSFVAQWGEKGSDDEQLWKPGGIEQAEDGRLFIADYGNHRGKIFTTDGQWEVSFGLGKAYTRESKEREQKEQEAAE